MSKIYLDNNASTPIDPRVLEEVVHALKLLGNPSSIHQFGREANALLIKARDRIVKFLDISPKELIFTSGGTEAANLAIRGLLNPARKGHIITSSIEHSAVYNTFGILEKDGYSVDYLNPGPDGSIPPEAVRKALRENTQMISIMAANNETGVKNDISAIARIAEEADILFVVDGVALFGKELFNIPVGVTAFLFSGHKIHAPKGAGAFFVRRKVKISPFLYGGGHERGIRAGTENLSGIVGLGKAVELLSEELPQMEEKMRRMRDRLEKGLITNLDNCVVNGSGKRVANTSNLAFSGVEGEVLLKLLDLEGIAASHGSACSSGALEPSRALLNMGLERERVRSSIRFSVSHMTTEDEIDRAIAVITRIVRKSAHFT